MKEKKIEDNVLWEEDQFSKGKIRRGGCCFLCLLIYLIYIYTLFWNQTEAIVAVFIVGLFFLFFFIYLVQTHFRITFTESNLYFKKGFLTKRINLLHTQQIEVIIAKRSSYYLDRKRIAESKRRTAGYYAKVKIIFKIYFQFNQKIKSFTIKRTFFASKGEYKEKEKAKEVAFEKRMAFEEKIKSLYEIFPQLITIIDIENK